MTILRKEGDGIEGRKIVVEFERHQGPHRIATKGRHNAQRIKAEGNPAAAVIVKQFEWIK